MFDINTLTKELKEKYNFMVIPSENGRFIIVNKENILELIRLLKEEFKFQMLSSVTAVDYNDRYEVVYHIAEADAKLLQIKVMLAKDNPVMPSIISAWKAAGVQEREIYDLMGIIFVGHGNLKRILCEDDFEGHPLRKDFLLTPVSRY